MCCFFTILVLLGPRLAILVWYILNPARFSAAVQTWPAPQWVWALLGSLFIPWTSIAYLFVFPGGVHGLDWLWLALGFLIDLSAHSGGGYRHRNRLRGRTV